MTTIQPERFRAPRWISWRAACGAAALALAGCGGGGGSDEAQLQDADALLGRGPGPVAAPAAGSHLERLNEVRSRMGLAPLRRNGALTASAQAHADYLVRHETGGHEEEPGTAGFTGASVADRARAAGYGGQLVQEAKAGGQALSEAEGRERMDALLQAPMHRMQLLAPEFDEAGVGVAAQGGPLVTNLGASGKRVRTGERRWMYPYNGQTGVPAAFLPGTEAGLDSALPPVTGTPLTLSGFLFSMVSYRSVVLQEEQTGEEVPLVTRDAAGEVRAALVFFPATVLKPATHYVWKITATVDGITSSTTSKFVTE